MRDFQEFTCENFALRLIIIGCALSTPALPDSPPSSSVRSRPPASAPLLDVQDRIKTIDQAGLYVLLDRLCSPDSQHLPALSPNPLDVYAQPNMFRGKLLRYDALLHPHLEPISLSRPVQHFQLYYVTAKIPFANNRQMPAIILLRDRPEPFPIDRATVTGYFYMVLRQATRKPPTQTGPDTVDLLVILAASLTPTGFETTYDNLDSFRSIRFSLLVLGGLLAVWLLLRRKTMGTGQLGLPRLRKRRSS